MTVTRPPFTVHFRAVHLIVLNSIVFFFKYFLSPDDGLSKQMKHVAIWYENNTTQSCDL